MLAALGISVGFLCLLRAVMAELGAQSTCFRLVLYGDAQYLLLCAPLLDSL